MPFLHARAQVARARGRRRCGWWRSTSAAPGADALDCPALQRADGRLGPDAADARGGHAAARSGSATERRFFTTADTVEDLEALRIALKADKLTLDGTSYGTYVAQRYALAHPERVSGLVLDSVVPAEGVSLLSEVSIKATRRVLGERRPPSAGEGHPRAATTARRCSTC